MSTESLPAPTLATEAPINPGDLTPVTGNGPCSNAYYPVREGATWTYASTGSPAGDYGYTDTITSVRDDGYTLTSQFKNVTRTQEWACKPEGLMALQLGGGAVTSEKLKLQVETQNASGVTYPTQVNTGDQWDYSLEFTGKMEIAGNPGEAAGSEKVHFNALGEESVTVPTGTFTSSYIYWFVQGVGWVKANGTGSIMGESYSENIELQSYAIP